MNKSLDIDSDLLESKLILAKSYLHSRDSNGINACKDLLKEAEKMGNNKILAETLRLLGHNYLFKRDFHNGITYFEPSLLISNEINDKKKNGIILEDINPQGIRRTIENLSQMRAQLSEYSKNAMQDVEKYSYEIYNHRILNEIIQN